MKFDCLIGIFLNSANLICQSTDISKCFRGSLHFRDNESRLYVKTRFFSIRGFFEILVFEISRLTVCRYAQTFYSAVIIDDTIRHYIKMNFVEIAEDSILQHLL